MARPEDQVISLFYHTTFFAIAHRNHVEVERLTAERDQLADELRLKSGASDRHVDLIAEKNAGIQRYAIVVVVFCALTLEAYINHYAIEKVSKSFLQKYLDKLDPVGKWLIIPKLVTGKQFDTGGQAFELLQGLFKLRNQLVHYKTQRKLIRDLTAEDWIEEGPARDAMKAVKLTMAALSELDTSVSTDWLQTTKTDPFA